MSFKITFNSVDIPSFVKVKAVNFAVLPSLNHNFKQIAGGRGVLESGTTLGEKVLKMEITIVPDSGKSLTAMSRELAYWVMGNNFKTCPLLISDENTMTYKAKINNSLDISDLLFVGEGALEFVVPSGVASGITSSISVTGGNSTTINYNGTATSYPVIKWTVTSAITGGTQVFTCTETGKSMSITGNFAIGEVITIDCSKKVVKRGSVVDMLLINYSSDWLTIPKRGSYHITTTRTGNYTTDVVDYWL